MIVQNSFGVAEFNIGGATATSKEYKVSPLALRGEGLATPHKVTRSV